jgi:hypothetical protein
MKTIVVLLACLSAVLLAIIAIFGYPVYQEWRSYKAQYQEGRTEAAEDLNDGTPVFYVLGSQKNEDALPYEIAEKLSLRRVDAFDAKKKQFYLGYNEEMSRRIVLGLIKARDARAAK